MVDQALALSGVDPRAGMLSKGNLGGPQALPGGMTEDALPDGEAPVVGLADFQRKLAEDPQAAFGVGVQAEGPPSDSAMVTVLVQTAMERMDAGHAEAWAKMDGDTVIVKWRFKPADEEEA